MTLLAEYVKLESKVKERLAKLIQKRGVESKFSNTKVLKIKEGEQFNLADRGHYAVEISIEKIIDNSGYEYYFSVLTLEQLCEIIDNI